MESDIVGIASSVTGSLLSHNNIAISALIFLVMILLGLLLLSGYVIYKLANKILSDITKTNAELADALHELSDKLLSRRRKGDTDVP